MKRKNFLNLLKNYKPKYLEEQYFQKRMIDFTMDNATCFERSNEMGHFTASAWLLSKDRHKALLMHHAKLDKWFQLGGHCDGDSDVLSVAIKEAKEESGIENIAPISENIFDIDIHEIPENKGIKKHIHYDIRFLLYCFGDEQYKRNRESKALVWINKNFNSDNTISLNSSVIRMIEKWRNLDLFKKRT